LDPVYYDDVAAGDATEEDIADYIVSAKDIYDAYAAYFEVGTDYESYVSLYILNDHIGYTFEGDGSNVNSGVGIAKTGEYKIIIALQTAISDFDLKYNLTSNWLVNEDLYEKCKIVDNGVVSSSYGTSLETSISYGPYKLVKYQLDQYFELEYNPYWYGYSDGNHEGQFQTTNLAYYYRTEHTTIMNDFLAGTLDDVSLTGDDMATYGNSRYFYSEPESYTYQFFLCADLDSLKERDTNSENHSILSLESFRRALSYTMNRASYCTQYDPTSSSGYGLLNYLYTVDPDTGLAYRETDAAKKVILRNNGFTEQTDGTWKDHNGTSYASLDLAYNAVTGYDVEYAKELFQQAFNEAREQGILTDSQLAGSGVVIDRGATTTTTNGAAMIAWINELLNDATKGTGLEGKVKLQYNTTYNTTSTFWAAVKSNKLDLAFSGWGGSALDPWSVLYNCYVNPDNSLNPSFKNVADSMSVTIDLSTYGKGTLTASLTDWTKWLANFQDDSDFAGDNLYTKLGSMLDADLDMKIEVLAACEEAQLSVCYNLPIFYSTVAALKSAKYKNGSDTYLGSMIGYGGIRHVTYYYSDSEWAEFVASYNGDLGSLYRG
jgi:oligopeptide transport system substrate-binding protein